MTNLDPLSLSILVKAVDFLFDQAAKIMQEARGNKMSATEIVYEQNNITSKKNIIESITDEINVNEVQHCLEQIRQSTKNIQKLEKNIILLHGAEALAPLDKINQLNAIRGELRTWIFKLKQLLETASKKSISIQGL